MKRRDRDQAYGPSEWAKPDARGIVRSAGAQAKLGGSERPRLTIGLVPETCWLSTVRDARDRWSFDLEALRTYGADPDALVM
jgi:hypothetical protein